MRGIRFFGALMPLTVSLAVGAGELDEWFMTGETERLPASEQRGAFPEDAVFESAAFCAKASVSEAGFVFDSSVWTQRTSIPLDWFSSMPVGFLLLFR